MLNYSDFKIKYTVSMMLQNTKIPPLKNSLQLFNKEKKTFSIYNNLLLNDFGQ